jgi:exonuclease VII small subunit
MRYTDFEGEFLRYLYRESLGSEGFVDFRQLADRYEIPFEPGYLRAIHGDLKRPGYIEGPDVFTGSSPVVGRLTGHGLAYVEKLHKDDLPASLSSWRELRGDKAEHMIPASDRLVSLNHNSPEYAFVEQTLDELEEALRSINAGDFSLEEKGRLLAGLAGAKALWKATELKALQIKVGVLIAIEDAAAALSSTAKAVSVGLVIDTIKALVKSKAGLDLDHL